MKKGSKKNKGFTLLEIMVSITIFSFGLIGVSSLMLQAMQAETLNAGYLKASMLAQEGIELTRGLRDENWLSQGANFWDDNIAGSLDDTFIIDYNGLPDDTPNSLDDSSTFLSLDANNFYSHSGGTPSSYRRLIELDNSCGTYCWNIKSHVRWISSGKVNNYIAETMLYDWR